MNTDNYIVINGKKTKLTEEQLKELGIKQSNKSVFSRVDDERQYYYIDESGIVGRQYDTHNDRHNDLYDVANYCTDKALMEQRALHETLNRLLWRFSMEHDGDKIDWDNPISSKTYICYNYKTKTWSITATLRFRDVGQIYFYTKDIAKLAIEKIVKPFMAEHPDFKG